VTRDRGRRRLRRLVVALALAGALAGIVGVVFSPVLDVDRVTVVGVGRERIDAVRAAAQVSPGSPLLTVDTGAVTERLLALPWVQRAEVHRELPGTLMVRITPRSAVAWVRDGDGSVHLVSTRGTVVGTVSGTPAALPELVGPLRAAGKIAAALPAALRARVAAVVVDHDLAVLHLVQGPEIRLGAMVDVSAKARAAAAVLTALGAAPAHYIDVQVATAPAVG
jgi:cell division protein FtsQ